MTAYRKKPVVIEAVHYTGANLEEISRHMGTSLPANTDHLIGNPIFIETLEGTMLAEVGDFIIKGVKGEFYPCKPDIFAATYEPAETRAPDPDLEAHIGAVLAEAAEHARNKWRDWKESDPGDCDVECDVTACANIADGILTLRPTALTALDRALREALVEGMERCLAVLADEGWVGESHRRICALIEAAEKEGKP